MDLDLEISKIDDVYVRVHCDAGIAMELSEYFRFQAPNFKFHPQYKMRMWDGYIKLFQLGTNRIYSGLIPHIRTFAHERNYKLEVPPELAHDYYTVPEYEKKLGQVMNQAQRYNLPFSLRDYQAHAIAHAMFTGRTLLLSPTGSGKSLMIYFLCRHFLEVQSRKILIIVPTIGLVSQMYSDFEDYTQKDSFSVVKNTHTIYGGQEKDFIPEKIVISTWQSIYKLPQSWFNQFHCVFGDEVHLFKAKSLIGLMQKTVTAPIKIGTTGTLDGTQVHKLVLEGLFGKTFSVTTTKELMDKQYLAKLKINCVLLKYSETDCNIVKKMLYPEEFSWLVGHPKRNRFVANLALGLKGNTLILFRFVDKQGKVIHSILKEEMEKNYPNRKLFFVAGETEASIREEVRKIIETQADAIVVASEGVFSTGTNIKNLDNLVLASPSKGRIRILQSIGRSLRIGRSDTATLYDIIDDLKYKKRLNFGLKHFLERIKIYSSEKFNYKIFKVDFSNK